MEYHHKCCYPIDRAFQQSVVLISGHARGCNVTPLRSVVWSGRALTLWAPVGLNSKAGRGGGEGWWWLRLVAIPCSVQGLYMVEGAHKLPTLFCLPASAKHRRLKNPGDAAKAGIHCYCCRNARCTMRHMDAKAQPNQRTPPPILLLLLSLTEVACCSHTSNGQGVLLL